MRTSFSRNVCAKQRQTFLSPVKNELPDIRSFSRTLAGQSACAKRAWCGVVQPLTYSLFWREVFIEKGSYTVIQFHLVFQIRHPMRFSTDQKFFVGHMVFVQG